MKTDEMATKRSNRDSCIGFILGLNYDWDIASYEEPSIQMLRMKKEIGKL